VYCPAAAGEEKGTRRKTSSGAGDQRRALHALNRLTFGPRPGDVQRVMAIGVEKMDRPTTASREKIDDSALNVRLEPFRTVRMNTRNGGRFSRWPENQSVDERQEAHAIRRSSADDFIKFRSTSNRRKKNASRKLARIQIPQRLMAPVTHPSRFKRCSGEHERLRG